MVATFTRHGDAAPLGWDGHLVLLHGTEPERQAYLTAWVRWGLERDEKVVYAEAGDAEFGGGFLAMLRRRGVDVETAVAERRVETMTIAEYHTPGARLMTVRRAVAEGFRGVRMSVEATSAWASLPVGRHEAYEREIDTFCQEHPLSVLCQYDRAVAVGEPLRRAVTQHSGGIRQRQLQTSAGGDRFALTGEIDIFNTDLLALALRSATTPPRKLFHLDLSGVGFLSAAGCRAIAEGTSRFRDDGGKLVIVAPRPMVRKVLLVVGVDRLGGVELVATRR